MIRRARAASTPLFRKRSANGNLGRNSDPYWRVVNLQPILDATLPIQRHFITVVPAFFLGAWQLLASRKGSPSHRLIAGALTFIPGRIMYRIFPG